MTNLAVKPELPWHQMPAERVIQVTGSHRTDGLCEDEAARRREQFGPNFVSVRRGHGPVTRFLLQFHQPLIYILLGSALVTGIFKEWVDSSVILGVVLINAIIGFVQESKALAAIDALATTLTTEATVIRSGRKTRVPSRDLVPGDIVLLQSGDKVPADIRLLHCRDLQIAEAALTGESIPVQKAHDLLSADTALGDRKNLAYAATLATYGQGTGVVFATGDRTEVGRISQLIASADELQTPLTRRIAQFSRLLLFLILGLAALNFAVGYLRGEPAIEMFTASVALAVAAIPEGLPAAVTITLAIGVARMARRRAIIRKLPAVETLGSTTVICSDKTGTLTENQMTVTAILAGDDQYRLTGVGYEPKGHLLFTAEQGNTGIDLDVSAAVQLSADEIRRRVALSECLRAGLLCNDAALVLTEGRWAIQGDPTEGALVIAAAKAGLDANALREKLRRFDAIPFESDYQYMATLHDQGPGRPRLLYVKGSVESIVQRCDAALDSAGRVRSLDKQAVHAQVAELAARGLRVLAFARAELPADVASVGHEDLARGLTFLGMQAMIDPPRSEAVAAIRACRSAGISVKMITGDHALTAAAIARQLGLDGVQAQAPDQIPVVMGQDLARCTDDELIDVAAGTSVFARVAPEQKLRLVRALQARGHVVAMTGDGVNDAPALRQADIGVAMGRAGTEVAKEAADMVLTDDNFASIEAAVEEGRGVFDNLTKFIVWTLPTNAGQAMIILAAVLVGTALPIAPVQILWINMTTAILLGLMLAFEPQEPGVMERPPRDPRAPLLGRPLLARIGLVSGLLLLGAFGMFEWMTEIRGVGLEEARTVAVNVIVFGQLFYLFNCRSLTKSMFRIGLFTNIPALVGVLGMVALQLLFTYLPAMNRLFGAAPISWDVWAAILAFGLAVYIIIEVEKRLRGPHLDGAVSNSTKRANRDRSADALTATAFTSVREERAG